MPTNGNRQFGPSADVTSQLMPVVEGSHQPEPDFPDPGLIDALAQPPGEAAVTVGPGGNGRAPGTPVADGAPVPPEGSSRLGVDGGVPPGEQSAGVVRGEAAPPVPDGLGERVPGPPGGDGAAVAGPDGAGRRFAGMLVRLGGVLDRRGGVGASVLDLLRGRCGAAAGPVRGGAGHGRAGRGAPVMRRRRRRRLGWCHRGRRRMR